MCRSGVISRTLSSCLRGTCSARPHGTRAQCTRSSRPVCHVYTQTPGEAGKLVVSSIAARGLICPVYRCNTAEVDIVDVKI